MNKKNIFTVLSIVLSQLCFGQLTIQSGTNVNILNGTTVKIVKDTLHVNDQANLNNDGLIVLSDSASVNEAWGFPITGTGKEIIHYKPNNNLQGENIGGLGLQLFNSSTLDSIIVHRGHTDIFNNISINRWYQLGSDHFSADSVVVNYDSTELNGLDPLRLKTHNLKDTTTSNWQNIGGESQTYQVSMGTTDSLFLITLSETEITFDNYNEFVICENDTLNIEFIASGLFNNGNQFFLEVSDDNGLFNTPANYVDSISATSGNHIFNFTMPMVNVNSVNYQYRIVSDSARIISDTITNITINNLPSVNITSAPDSLCLNDVTTTLSGTPVGAFSGPGMINSSDFDPSLANIGNHEIIYSFSNTNGCTNFDTTNIEVLNLPSVSLNSTSNSVCIDGNEIELISSPANGTFTHIAVDQSFFWPDDAGTGMHNVGYVAYDTILGCTDTAYQIIQVHELPSLSIGNLSDEYCVNDTPEVLNPLPSGGILSGDGVVFINQFDPGTAGIGVHNVSYTYTDTNSCENTVIEPVIVYSLPDTPYVSLNGSTLASSINGNLQWYLNGNPIPGANSQFYEADQNGFYTVEITNSYGCSIMSDIFNFEYNSLSENTFENITISPNPGNEYAIIENINETQTVLISIYSSAGKLLKQELSHNGNTNHYLDFTLYDAGMYFIKISDQRNKYSKRVKWIKL